MLRAFPEGVQDESLIVMEDLKMTAPKTKEMAAILKNLESGKSADRHKRKDEDVVRAAANIQGSKRCRLQRSPYMTS